MSEEKKIQIPKNDQTDPKAETMNSLPLDSDTNAKIAELQEKRQHIIDGIDLCDQAGTDQESPADQMQLIVDRIDRTIAALQNGLNSSPNMFKRYYVRFSIPQASTQRPVDVHIRLDQMPESIPLELNYYILVKPPIGESYSTPRIVSKLTQVNYNLTFQIPDRSQRSISMAKANDIVFEIYKYTTQFHIAVGKGKVDLVATAKTPLMPLCFQTSNSIPLEFISPDGEPTDYHFDVTMTTEEPLISGSNLVIEDQIELLKE